MFKNIYESDNSQKKFYIYFYLNNIYTIKIKKVNILKI